MDFSNILVVKPIAVSYILRGMENFPSFLTCAAAMQQIFPVLVVSDDLQIYRSVAIDELHLSGCSAVCFTQQHLTNVVSKQWNSFYTLLFAKWG